MLNLLDIQQVTGSPNLEKCGQVTGLHEMLNVAYLVKLGVGSIL